jgi:hypothetical protein
MPLKQTQKLCLLTVTIENELRHKEARSRRNITTMTGFIVSSIARM